MNGIPIAKIDKEGFRGLQIYLSLSHCQDYAIALAIVIEKQELFTVT